MKDSSWYKLRTGLDLQQQAARRRAHWRKALKRAARDWPSRQLDDFFHSAHDEAFRHIDCLSCANCCQTTSPIFKPSDIERIARREQRRFADIVRSYLRVDEDGDYVLQRSPCPFLQADKRCGIYEDRPDACREYPHTNRKAMREIGELTLRNGEVCPAVYGILEALASVV